MSDGVDAMNPPAERQTEVRQNRIKTIQTAAFAGVLLFLATVAVSISVSLSATWEAVFPPIAPRKELGAHKLVRIVQTSFFDGMHWITGFRLVPREADMPPDAATAPSGELSGPPSSAGQVQPGPVFADIVSVRWTLGNGQSILGSEAFGVYLRPGNHVVEVEALDRQGKLIGWDLAEVKVSNESGLNLINDAPGDHYLNISAVGSLIAVKGEPVGYQGLTDMRGSFGLLGTADGYTILQTRRSGYFQIRTIASADGMPAASSEGNTIPEAHTYFVFVSPVPSKHVDRTDQDWYLTQFNTETTSNCGPTVTAMSIRWARGVAVNVVDIRNRVGWEGDGAVSMNQLHTVLEEYGVQSRMFELTSTDEIFDILDQGKLVAVSYNMAGVQPVSDPQTNLLGQYYVDSGGHYITIKGYSLDRKYLIVYDPIPSDWANNSGRYGDGVSMYGRNRYYPVDQLWQALRSRLALEISR